MSYVRQPIFAQIHKVLDLHFQGQRFESNTLGSSYGIILQTMTYRTNIAIVNTESHMWPLDWHVYIWPWSILKGRVKVMHILTVNILQTVSADMANIAIANKYKAAYSISIGMFTFDLGPF